MNRISPYGNESERKKVKGRRVNLKMFPEFIFFYYKGMFGYYICEFSSGFAAGYGDTLKEAKKTVVSNLKNAKIKKFRQMIKKCIKENGYANKTETL
jgi:hypothetical protein